MFLSNGTEIKEYRMTNGATDAVVVSEDRRGMTDAEWDEYCAYLKGLSLEESRARLANRLPPRSFHTKDSDCTINPDTLLCDACGVDHSDECPECGGRGFHKDTCVTMLGGEMAEVVR